MFSNLGGAHTPIWKKWADSIIYLTDSRTNLMVWEIGVNDDDWHSKQKYSISIKATIFVMNVLNLELCGFI